MLTTGDIGQLGNVDSGRIFLGVGLLAMAMLALTIVQIWLLVTRGQTIGKWILGIRIVRQTDGGKADFGHVWALRSLLPGFIGFLPYLGMIFTLADVFFIFRADRRCLHDLMADTKVVKV